MMTDTTIKLTKLQKELLEDIVAEALQNLKEMEYRKTVANALNDLLNKLEQA
jgi:3-methyladenine DNA glycosylase AlkC